ncbi:HEAT repeat domain-containing protein [Candidatus Fermentibacteria bacterium]|nr:HEAT repeat domain-containing protein [Candidatus Fermentibacteria bacterium]
MLSVIILSALSSLPHPGLPTGADSLLALALDSLDLEPAQMNFDRNWAPGVRLPDSIAILCLQDIFAIPGVLAEHVEAAYGLLSPMPGDEDLTDLVTLVRQREQAYRAAFETLTPGGRDTLAAIASSLWSDSDNPGEWGAWGSFLESRGIQPPPEFEANPDTLALWLEKWPAVVPLDASRLTALALALSGVEWHEPSLLEISGVEGTVCTLESASGYIVGGPGDNRYTADTPFGIIIDIGGNDTYEDLGGAFGPEGGFASVIIDLGGDDRYFSSVPVSCGAGLMGFGALIDISGDDCYEAGPVSLGAGLLGEGILADLGGSDYYSSDFFSQGAGCIGRGLLLDSSGDDTYRCAMFGQGFGGPRGYGLLTDGAGHDCYLAGFRYSHAPLRPDDNRAMSQGFAMGLRPVIAGGRGLLADFGTGNDTYRAEIFGQGGAYWYGLGMLFDEGGQDCYNAAQYAQGSGIHLAAGCLWDGGGDDGYFSRFGPSQGAAHDLSTGFFYDASGLDCYMSDGAQGFSINNSAVIFIDSSGTDRYFPGGDGLGLGSWASGSASVCAFIDMADDDLYLRRGADSLCWTDGAYGAGIDASVVIPPEEITPEQIGNPEELDLDSLFSVASEWEVGENQARVLAHREELARRGAPAIDYIIERQMNTTDGLALRAMEVAIEANAGYALPRLLELLDSLSGRRLRNCIYLLGVTGGEEARLPLEAMLPSDSTATNISVISALGQIGNPASLPVIESLADDPCSRTRRAVAVALGDIGDSTAVGVLEALAEDRQLDVRSAAENSIRLLENE